MGFIAWIVVGAIAGWIASRVMNSKEGLLMMVGLGIVGGLVGGWLAANVFKMGSVDGINIETIFIATLGAILVIFVANLATGKGRLGARAG
jgi:uncharacterized membrane protein YeaQ/YmgE (transglycosylase-associated protein family)